MLHDIPAGCTAVGMPARPTKRPVPNPAIAAATESLDRTAWLEDQLRRLEERLAVLPVSLPESASHNRPLLPRSSRERRLGKATALS